MYIYIYIAVRLYPIGVVFARSQSETLSIRTELHAALNMHWDNKTNVPLVRRRSMASEIGCVTKLWPGER